MSNTMSVFLSQEAAAPQWGDKAIISFTETGATVHLGEGHDLGAIQRAARKLDSQGISNATLAGEGWDLESTWAFYQGYRNSKKSTQVTLPSLGEQDENELNARIKASNWTRDIINKSAEEVAPRQLATMAAEFIKSTAPEHVTYRIVKDKDLLTEGWEGIFAVVAVLNVHRHAATRLHPLVTKCPSICVPSSKGITFDSVLQPEPSNFMSAMKADMGGAGTITGGLGLAIMRGLNKRVKLILCCAENMVSGRALKLGDVITYKNGKTVEIMNTDAEGRLVLADGLIYASEQNPELIIDCATLTGAAKNALGNDYHAIMSFDDELTHQALTNANQEKEGLWPLPLADFHRGMLPSNFADLSNISSGDYSPGASTAAAFLSYFVTDYKKGWLHFDCAGTYRKAGTDKWSAGATGMGIRTLARLLTEQAQTK
ncbi:aminopeptidase B [Vibrio mediterranei AK1]|uniref:aminopeptidase PepB n=1 Tax=Vibrio mediterranei TaxID=689 RepID=UPI0001541488|nr:aminopeptidase PepB [Vibrio mediterranei]EDL53084.1 aminopeptidase B [Vibrio mediterranei AK1]